MSFILKKCWIMRSRDLIKLTLRGTKNCSSETSPISRVFLTEKLTHHNLESLIVKESIDAIVIPKYCSPSLCKVLSSYMLNSQVERYDHEIYNTETRKIEKIYAGVDRVGLPFNKVFSEMDNLKKIKIREEYYELAKKLMKNFREVCGDFISPIDRLRLELEDTFSEGARVGRFEGRQMLCGIGRVSDPALSLGGEQPHFDMLPEYIYPLDKQFAANIYIKVPKQGGMLKIWGRKTYSREKIIELSLDKNIVKDEEEPVEILPQEGDLIIFNTRRPHAVTRFNSDFRISLQTFIGYKTGEPLFLWN
ncbi:uncharacterized protein LOC100204208 isoform X2 [Hydra vulgaris]|uniref:Uncharacterized protein LOC100204208 isoform X2 n=1 Tax=Hydra vulgaris TaxID=6087 RepID=A0ABM4CJB2_HYDVU